MAHWGAILECDLIKDHDGLHEDQTLGVLWLAASERNRLTIVQA